MHLVSPPSPSSPVLWWAEKGRGLSGHSGSYLWVSSPHKRRFVSVLILAHSQPAVGFQQRNRRTGKPLDGRLFTAENTIRRGGGAKFLFMMRGNSFALSFFNLYKSRSFWFCEALRNKLAVESSSDSSISAVSLSIFWTQTLKTWMNERVDNKDV